MPKCGSSFRWNSLLFGILLPFHYNSSFWLQFASFRYTSSFSWKFFLSLQFPLIGAFLLRLLIVILFPFRDNSLLFVVVLSCRCNSSFSLYTFSFSLLIPFCVRTSSFSYNFCLFVRSLPSRHTFPVCGSSSFPLQRFPSLQLSLFVTASSFRWNSRLRFSWHFLFLV